MQIGLLVSNNIGSFEQSELLEKKKLPLAYEIFCFIRSNFDVLASNEKNCLYVYSSNTGCYNEMKANKFGIFFIKNT